MPIFDFVGFDPNAFRAPRYDGPTMSTWLYPLTHGDYGDAENTILRNEETEVWANSTCFVVQPHKQPEVLYVYFGDVSLSKHPYQYEDAEPHKPEKQIDAIVDACADRFSQHVLLGRTKTVNVFLECAFPKTTEKIMVGHINTNQFVKFVKKFAEKLCGAQLNFFVTHRKPNFRDGSFDTAPVREIEDELKFEEQGLPRTVKIFFPTQGESWPKEPPECVVTHPSTPKSPRSPLSPSLVIPSLSKMNCR